MRKFFLFIIVIFLISSSLWATWSIVAVNPETGEAGSAGASYTPAVWPILGITGGDCESWAGHIGDDLVMVQGNILVSEAVVEDTLAAYKTARVAGEPLAGALVTALSAGSAAGGDKRAGDTSVAAMTAYVAVAVPEDPPGYASFAIIVPPLSGGGNPVNELERLYREKAGSPQPLFFPSMKNLILMFIIIPSAVGIILFFVFSAIRKKTKTLAALVWAGSVFGSMAAQQIVIVILCRMGWAMPIYGYFAKIYPAILIIILCIIFFIISLIQMKMLNRSV